MSMVLAASSTPPSRNTPNCATQPEHAKLRQWLLDKLPKASIIIRVEILGYHKLQDAEQAALTELLDNLELVYLTPACYEIAIQLRQRQKLTLVIAATCLERGYALATGPTSAILNGLRN